MEMSNLSDKDFRVMVIKIFIRLDKRVDELSENSNKETEKYEKEPNRTEG